MDENRPKRNERSSNLFAVHFALLLVSRLAVGSAAGDR